jgi:hypoxanthine phosphoribosyltransferase
MIQLHDKQFVPFLSAQEINRKMTAVEADFKDEVPVL